MGSKEIFKFLNVKGKIQSRHTYQSSLIKRKINKVTE